MTSDLHFRKILVSVEKMNCRGLRKNPPANAGDTGLIPGWGRSPGVGNGNPLQYSCLENPMDRGARCTIQSMGGHKESDTTKQLNTHRELILNE